MTLAGRKTPVPAPTPSRALLAVVPSGETWATTDAVLVAAQEVQLDVADVEHAAALLRSLRRRGLVRCTRNGDVVQWQATSNVARSA